MAVETFGEDQNHSNQEHQLRLIKALPVKLMIARDTVSESATLVFSELTGVAKSFAKNTPHIPKK